MARLPIKLNTDVADEVLPRKLSKSELRQIQIIENSIKLCAKHGIEALGYGQIAEECGVTRHLVIHYFPTRDDIIERAMEYVWATLKLEILEAVDREATSLAKLRTYITANFSWARKHRNHLVFVSLFHHYAASKRKFRELNSQLMHLGQQRILGILKAGVENGEFLKREKIEYEAKCIQLAIAGHLMSLVTEEPALETSIMEGQLVHFVIERFVTKQK